MTDYAKLAKAARIEILKMIHRAQTSHIASNFSVVDIATVLYENLKEEDKVVWSKGWAAASIYYFNAKYGRGDKEAPIKFPESPYFGLAETTVEGVEVNGGSVGHGLSVAVGMALAKKLKGEEGQIYCIMSDGELNEGSVWEAAAFAFHHELNNLVAIIDRNFVQAMGYTSEIMNIDPRMAFGGFKWRTDLVDGHNHKMIEESLKSESDSSPFVIVANTTKGKGVSFMEGLLLYHYKHVDDETYEKALAELNA